MSGDNGRSAIELLGKHDAGEPMRQGHAPERQLEIGAGQHLRREPLGAADEKSEPAPGEEKANEDDPTT
jgi:hypothetical protein